MQYTIWQIHDQIRSLHVDIQTQKKKDTCQVPYVWTTMP